MASRPASQCYPCSGPQGPTTHPRLKPAISGKKVSSQLRSSALPARPQPLSTRETFEHHLPPSREGSAGSHHHPAGDTGPLQSRQYAGLQQHGGSPGHGTAAHPQHHPKHSPGHREQALLQDRAGTLLNSGEEGVSKRFSAQHRPCCQSTQAREDSTALRGKNGRISSQALTTTRCDSPIPAEESFAECKYL